jgi:antitoxin component YwqK of YwqJK toxin-antitoxin module
VMKYLFLFIFIFSLIGCKTNQVKDGKRERKWVFKDVTNDTIHFQKGWYKDGVETGVWKTYENKKLYRKEKYKGNVCYITNYHPNGRIQSKGTALIDQQNGVIQWKMSGDWDYFDESGKHYLTRTYLNGYQITEKKIE